MQDLLEFFAETRSCDLTGIMISDQCKQRILYSLKSVSELVKTS